MKKALLTVVIFLGILTAGMAESSIATFVTEGVSYQLYSDSLIIQDFEMTKGYKIDDVSILNEHYRVSFSDPENRLSFIKNKNNSYTLVGKIDGRDIMIRKLKKL